MLNLRLFFRTIVVALALLAWPGTAPAHEVPNETTVLTFLKPEGTTLKLLLRAPMDALRDVDVPVREDGFLDLPRVETPLRHAAQLWITDFVKLYEDGAPLPQPRLVNARVSLPSDRSFTSYDQALAHIRGAPLAEETEIYWQQGLLDIEYEYPIASEASRFSIEPGLTRLGVQVNVTLRFLHPDGAERAFDVHADVGRVELDPSWWQAFYLFAKEGFFHILDGIDHLLFLFALVIPFQKLRPLVVIVTSFTVAHSITLAASAFGLAPGALWFPYLIETLIAASIVYMGLENIVGANIERRWWLTFAFGLVHGFGFSFLLGERLQFAGSHLVTSLLAFNIGVELGQLLVLAIAIPALTLLFRYVLPKRIGTIILSALVTHTAWHWMTERGAELTSFPWPTLDAVALSAALWWAMAAVAVAALLWLFSGLVRRWNGVDPTPVASDRSA
ncbi:HupE/UreJ family protein [Marinivivus vitaminiproducens]|uniref:HupE/UreJ family protein n=1 Tax=Marinivivus vitaminiproducens TaxID=3035935 RepID=UPI0027A004C0|nr:HupE/UreJ family protein [Geminicoccaceae bacterium SCSIO 64248]